MIFLILFPFNLFNDQFDNRYENEKTTETIIGTIKLINIAAVKIP